MFARSTQRSARLACSARPIAPRVRIQNVKPRYASTAAEQNTGSSHIVAGLAGGSLVFLIGYGYYHFSGAKTIVNALHSTKSQFDSIVKKSTDNAPKPNEAIQWLKETVQSYTRMIPGAQQYVDSAFKDLETINKQHGPEVEKIVNDTYSQLKDATKNGASMETAIAAWGVLQAALSQLGGLAKDAGKDIIGNHPELKEKLGGRFEQLQNMAEQYGPEAKKQVDETYKQIQDIVKSGLSGDGLKKIQDLVQEKSEQIKKYGDEAWSKGLEQAKPLLDKNPKIKEFVEKNKDQLLQGNLGEMWQKLKGMAEKGDADEAMKYLQSQVDNVKDKAGKSMPSSLSALIGQFPGADELGDKLKKLQELYSKRGKEAEDLVKSAVEDIKKVLEKHVDEGQKLAEKSKDDVKSK